MVGLLIAFIVLGIQLAFWASVVCAAVAVVYGICCMMVGWVKSIWDEA